MFTAKIKQEPCSAHTQKVKEEIPLEPHLNTIGDMVMKSLKQFGLQIASEEIVPGVHYPAAHRMLIQVFLCLNLLLGA